MGLFDLVGLDEGDKAESFYGWSTIDSYYFSKFRYFLFSPSYVRFIVFINIYSRDFFVLYMKSMCWAVCGLFGLF